MAVGSYFPFVILILSSLIIFCVALYVVALYGKESRKSNPSITRLDFLRGFASALFCLVLVIGIMSVMVIFSLKVL